MSELNLVEEGGSLGAIGAEPLVGGLEKNNGIFTLFLQLFDLLLQRLLYPVLPHGQVIGPFKDHMLLLHPPALTVGSYCFAPLP